MAVRSFVDPEDREWSVWDVTPSRKSDLFLPADMAEGWLCFEAAHEKRRLAPYGTEWEGMDGPALWDLCQRAVPVKPRVTRPVADPQPEPEPT